MTYGFCVYHGIECDYKGNCINCPHNTEEDVEWFKQDEEQEESKDNNTEGENECDKDCIHCGWATCPLVEPGKPEPYSEKIKEIRNAYKEGYAKGYDEGYITGEAQADAWLVIEEHINDILDKIRAEIEFEVDHRTYMLCAEDVFEIIDKHKVGSEDNE